MPPAIPNSPEMNEVEMMAQAMRAKSKGVIQQPVSRTRCSAPAMHRRCGTAPSFGAWDGPGSAAHHCMLRCARDTALLCTPRQRAVDHADGVVYPIDRDERAEARTFLLAEQHL